MTSRAVRTPTFVSPSAAGEAPDGPARRCSESSLAWDLAAVVAPLLRKPARNQIYVTLGAGESATAITLLVVTAVDQDVALPRGLIAPITRWLDAYGGTLLEEQLRPLVEALRTGSSVRRDVRTANRSSGSAT